MIPPGLCPSRRTSSALLYVLTLLTALPATAQTTVPPPASAPAPAIVPVDSSATPSDDAIAPGSTVITCNESQADDVAHTSVFTGDVKVVGTNFTMTCQQMTVYFNKENKINHILAVHDVIITQPDRVAHAGQADYYGEDDRFVLTDKPVVLDKKNKFTAPIITYYRSKQTMYGSGGPTGGRTTVVLGEGAFGSSTTAKPKPSVPPTAKPQK